MHVLMKFYYSRLNSSKNMYFASICLKVTVFALNIILQSVLYRPVTLKACYKRPCMACHWKQYFEFTL